MFRTTTIACVVLFGAWGCDGGQAVRSEKKADRPEIEPAARSSTASPEARGSDATPDIAVDTPDLDQPVTAAAALQPARAASGESLTVVVKIQTAPTWHIYAASGAIGTGVPTTLKLELPEGMETAGEWILPQARQDGQNRIYEGCIEFRRQLRIGSGAKPGPIQVSCTLSYQACDPFHCRPPEEKSLKAAAVLDAKP